MTDSRRPALALTVDVEDWAQSSWDRSRAIGEESADQARILLDLVGRFAGARGTFFVLGKFAERHPDVVQEIADRGHEVACHGYAHVEAFRQGPNEFRRDLERSTAVLADICGGAPIGYRAGDFSVVSESLWALDVLADSGYRYDSSIFPIARARYGIPTWPAHPATVTLAGGATIIEFPVATVTVGGRRLPAGGGGYARLAPWPLLKAGLDRAQAPGAPPVFYCHPYELDAGEFAVLDAPIPLRVRLHQGLGRRGMARKLEHLVDQFACVALADCLEQATRFPAVSAADHAGASVGPDRKAIPWVAG